MPLDINIAKGDNRTYRVKLVGTLDTDTSGKLEQSMLEVWNDPNARAIQMDFTFLTFISSMGLGAIAKIRKSITARGGVMVTVGAQPQITRVFEIVKMLPKETIFGSRAEADEYLAAIQHQVIQDLRPNPDSPPAP